MTSLISNKIIVGNVRPCPDMNRILCRISQKNVMFKIVTLVQVHTHTVHTVKLRNLVKSSNIFKKNNITFIIFINIQEEMQI